MQRPRMTEQDFLAWMNCQLKPGPLLDLLANARGAVVGQSNPHGLTDHGARAEAWRAIAALPTQNGVDDP